MSYIKKVALSIVAASVLSGCAMGVSQQPVPQQARPPVVSIDDGIAKQLVRKFKKVSSLRASAMTYGDDPLLVGGDMFWQKALASDSTPQDTLQNLSLAEVMYGKYIFEAANRGGREVGKITPQPLIIDSPYPSKQKLYKNRGVAAAPKSAAANLTVSQKGWALSENQRVDPLQSGQDTSKQDARLARIEKMLADGGKAQPAVAALDTSKQDARLARIEKMLADGSKAQPAVAALDTSKQDARLARIEKMLADGSKAQPAVAERTIEIKDSLFAKAFKGASDNYTSKGSDDKGAFLRYRVKKGDSLWLISKRVFSDAELWPYIFDANRTKINNPHWIYPGQTFDFRSDSDDIATQSHYREQARVWARTRDILSVPAYSGSQPPSSFVNSNFYSDL